MRAVKKLVTLFTLKQYGITVRQKDLDERSQLILKERWLTDDKPTLHELADKYGISAERIRQIEKKAMEKIRTNIN